MWLKIFKWQSTLAPNDHQLVHNWSVVKGFNNNDLKMYFIRIYFKIMAVLVLKISQNDNIFQSKCYEFAVLDSS